MGAPPGPAHLLFFDNPSAHDLVDRRFGDRRGDGFFVAIAIVIIGDGRLIAANVLFKLVQGSGQLSGFWTRLGINLQFQAL